MLNYFYYPFMNTGKYYILLTTWARQKAESEINEGSVLSHI